MCINDKSLSDSSSTNAKSILRKKSDEISESLSSCESSSSCSSSESTKSVQFHTIEIREYNVIVGDNPCCSSGPPISLGWHYNQEVQNGMPLDQYEKYREGHRRTTHQMRIPASIRHQTLREWDIPTREILSAQETCETIKKQRCRTMRKHQRKSNIRTFTRRLVRKVISDNE